MPSDDALYIRWMRAEKECRAFSLRIYAETRDGRPPTRAQLAELERLGADACDLFRQYLARAAATPSPVVYVAVSGGSDERIAREARQEQEVRNVPDVPAVRNGGDASAPPGARAGDDRDPDSATVACQLCERIDERSTADWEGDLHFVCAARRTQRALHSEWKCPRCGTVWWQSRSRSAGRQTWRRGARPLIR